MAYGVEALTKRVERLERQNRHLKLVGIALVLPLVVLVSVGAVGKPRTVEAEKIVVLDSHGRARITIGMPEFAGAAVGMKPDAPGIWLSDENGIDRTILTDDGLHIGDSKGKPLVELSTDPSRSVLRFYGVDGKISWSAP
jgi:hypothetical protein